MTITARKTQLVIPQTVRRKAGIKAGDQLEFRASRGVITIVAQPPATDDEYTPAQRRVIDARLAKAEEDIKQGRVYGPFATVTELERSLRQTAKSSRAKGPAPR